MHQLHLAYHPGQRYNKYRADNIVADSALFNAVSISRKATSVKLRNIGHKIGLSSE